GTNGSGNGLNWVFVSACGAYTWTDTTNTHDWTNPLNWSPARATPAANDVLIFGSSTPAPVVTNVAGAIGGNTETIAELHINNSSPTFSTGGANNTLLINDGSGTGLDVSNSFPWAMIGSNALTIKLASGTLGAISGTVNIGGGGHRLIGQATGAITFQSTAIFATTSGMTGNGFGDGSSRA